MIVRKCKKCHTEYEVKYRTELQRYFYYINKEKGTLQSTCKKCESERAKQYKKESNGKHYDHRKYYDKIKYSREALLDDMNKFETEKLISFEKTLYNRLMELRGEIKRRQ